MIKNIPNIITCMRMVGTAVLLFIEPFTAAFYIVYTVCGITDVLDGLIARLMKTSSELGAKLDSIADLTFYAVMVLKILPVLWKKLPVSMWIFVFSIFGLRFISYGISAVKYRKFASLHTKLNKLTGFATYAIPYMIQLPIYLPLCWGGCTIAFLATVEELCIHLKGEKVNTKVKNT